MANSDNIVPMVLGLVAGIMTIILSTLTMDGTLLFDRDVAFMLGLWGILCGILIAVGGAIAYFSRKAGSAIVLIFGILALVTFQGLFIGPILAIVGGALGLVVK
jgi:hypothetical protein